MPTAKPRLQITLRPPTYLLLGRLAKLRRTSRAAIVAEFVEEVAPVLQRVETVLERAHEAQGWAKQWRADVETVQRQVEEAARVNLDLFESIGKSAGPERSEGPRTPGPVTRGSGVRNPLNRRAPGRKRLP